MVKPSFVVSSVAHALELWPTATPHFLEAIKMMTENPAQACLVQIWRTARGQKKYGVWRLENGETVFVQSTKKKGMSIRDGHRFPQHVYVLSDSANYLSILSSGEPRYKPTAEQMEVRYILDQRTLPPASKRKG